MASELGESKQIVIGAAIGPSIGSVFNTIENRLKYLEQQGSQLKLLQGSIDEARRLQTELDKVEDKGSRTATRLQDSLDAVRVKLKEQNVDVTRLDDAYAALGRAMQGIEQQQKGMQLLSEGKSSIAQAKTTFSTIIQQAQVAADFDAKVSDIVVKSRGDEVKLLDRGKSPEARAQQSKQRIVEKVTEVSRATRMSSDDGLALVAKLQAQGMSLDEALDKLPTAALYSVSQNVGAEDTAQLVAALSKFGVKDGEMQGALAGYAAQAKGSEHGIADMTRTLTQLLPVAARNGRSGVAEALKLGAVVQVHVPEAPSNEDGIKGIKAWLEGKHVETDKTAKGSPAAIGSEKAVQQYSALTEKATDGATTLVDDQSVRQAAGGGLKAAGNAWTDLKRDYGAIVLPYVDSMAGTFAQAAKGANELMNEQKGVVLVLTGFVALLSAAGAAVGAFKVARGVFDVTAGTYKQASGAVAGSGKGAALGSFFRLGRAVLEGGGDNRSGALAAGKSGPVDVFVVNLGGTAQSWQRLRQRQRNTRRASRSEDRSSRREAGAPAPARDNVATQTSPPARPASVNSGASASVTAADSLSLHRSPGALTTSRGETVVVPAQPGGSAGLPEGRGGAPLIDTNAHPSTLQPGGGGHASGVLGFASSAAPPSSSSLNAKSLLKRLPGVSWVDTGMQALEVALTATSTEERAEGLGAVAGGAGGTALGGMIGAALGTVLIPIPGVGSAVGAFVGSSLGGMLGEEYGARVGKAIVTKNDKSEGTSDRVSQVPARGPGDALVRNEASSVAVGVNPVPVDPFQSGGTMPPVVGGGGQPLANAVQAPPHITLSPTIPITVQGIISDPLDIVRKLEPELQRLFRNLMAQMNQGASMVDPPMS